MSLKDKRELLRKEIDEYRAERRDPYNQNNKSYQDWLNGLISGLERADCILDELETEANRGNNHS